MTAMNGFIDEYLCDPSHAVMNARERADCRFDGMDIKEDMVYSQIASPEFRFYSEVLIPD